MTHIMLDLETLSTQYNARILAIGAVKFDAEGVHEKFYQAVSGPPLEPLMQDHIDDDGFHISNATLTWWAQQGEKARTVFTDPNAVTIWSALMAFSTWAIEDVESIKDICMWGNGASFDNVILSTAYQIAGLRQPWMYYNDRCYRTVKNLYPHAQLVRTGTHHNALDDAESQAQHLIAMGVNLV